jgi:hypothetical protein
MGNVNRPVLFGSDYGEQGYMGYQRTWVKRHYLSTKQTPECSTGNTCI